METNLQSFKSDRKFCVFSYGISHGPLLLRSGKIAQHQTRIDVLIKDVRALEIRSWFEGLEMCEVDQNYLRDFSSNPIEMIEVGLRVYALTGDGEDLLSEATFLSTKMTQTSWPQVHFYLA